MAKQFARMRLGDGCDAPGLPAGLNDPDPFESTITHPGTAATRTTGILRERERLTTTSRRVSVFFVFRFSKLIKL